MDFIAIVFIATSIYLINKVIEKIVKPEKIITKICLIAASFLLILNQFTLEYLLFPESAVMCLGVLLNVVAIKIMIDNPKHKYLKIFVTLLIAALSYQGLLNMFPVMAILIYIIKLINDKKDYKSNLKEFIIEMIKLAVIVVVVLGICMIIIKIGTTLLDSDQDRTIKIKDEKALGFRADTVADYMDELWNKNMHTLPDHTNTIALIISFVLLILLKTKKEVILRYILLIIISFVMCVLPMFVFNTGIAGRVNNPLMMLWGASLIILIIQSTKVTDKSKINNMVYCFVILSFIFNNIFIMQNITHHIAANKVDDNEGMIIKHAIENHEKETGNKVTKFSYVYDKNPQQFATGIKPLGSLTERKLACSWSIVQAMNYYCDRKFERVKMPTNIFIDKFMNKDDDAFYEEQLYFEKDTVYMLVY